MPAEAIPVPAVASLLEARYGRYPDESGGPVLDQLVWFLLSTRTTVENCDAAYAALRAAYPDWEAVALAAEADLYGPSDPPDSTGPGHGASWRPSGRSGAASARSR